MCMREVQYKGEEGGIVFDLPGSESVNAGVERKRGREREVKAALFTTLKYS